MIGLNDKITCPACGNIDTLENYDVMGADEGFIFCNKCGCHFPRDGSQTTFEQLEDENKRLRKRLALFEGAEQ